MNTRAFPRRHSINTDSLTPQPPTLLRDRRGDARVYARAVVNDSKASSEGAQRVVATVVLTTVDGGSEIAWTSRTHAVQ